MARYKVRFAVPMEVVVYVDADDEDAAADEAWGLARERLSEAAVYQNGVAIFGDVDGVGADDVEEVR